MPALLPTGPTVARVEDLARTLFSRGSSAQTPEAKVFMALLVEAAEPPSPAAVQRELAGCDPQRAGKGTPTGTPPAAHLSVDKACREGRGAGEGTHRYRSGGDPTSKLPAENRVCEGNGEEAHRQGGETHW